MRWLDSSTDLTDMSLSKLWETVKDREVLSMEVTKSGARLSHLITNSNTAPKLFMSVT